MQHAEKLSDGSSSAASLAWKSLLSFGIFELFAACRVYLEMRVLDSNSEIIVSVHRFFWYTYVFMFFVACYRRILHVPFSKLMYLSLGGIILFIPPLYALLTHVPMTSNYLVSRDLRGILFELVTLHAGHEKNYIMFPELLVLLVGTAATSWFFSRKVKKTLINTLVAFYGSFLSAGLCWFSVERHHEAVLRLSSMFHSQQFYLLQFLGGVVILSLVAFGPEFLACLRRTGIAKRAVLPASVAALLYVVVFCAVAPHHDRPSAIADVAIVALPVASASFAPTILLDSLVPLPAKLFAIFLAGFAVLSLFAVFIVPVGL